MTTTCKGKKGDDAIEVSLAQTGIADKGIYFKKKNKNLHNK